MSTSINNDNGMYSAPVAVIGVAAREPRAPAPRSTCARRSISNKIAAALGKTGPIRLKSSGNLLRPNYFNPSGAPFGSTMGSRSEAGSMNPLLSSRSSGSIDLQDREVVVDEGKRFASASSLHVVEKNKNTTSSEWLSDLLVCVAKPVQASGGNHELSQLSSRDDGRSGKHVEDDEELDEIIEELRSKLAPSFISKPKDSNKEQDNYYMYCQQRKYLKNPLERVTNSLCQPSGKYLIGKQKKTEEEERPEMDFYLSSRENGGPKEEVLGPEEDGPEERIGESSQRERHTKFSSNNNQTHLQARARMRTRQIQQQHSTNNPSNSGSTTTFGRHLAAARAAAVPQTSRHRTVDDFYLELEDQKGCSSSCELIESMSPVGPWMATEMMNGNKNSTTCIGNQKKNHQSSRLDIKNFKLKSDPATLSPHSKLLWISEQSTTSSCSSFVNDNDASIVHGRKQNHHPLVPMLSYQQEKTNTGSTYSSGMHTNRSTSSIRSEEVNTGTEKSTTAPLTVKNSTGNNKKKKKKFKKTQANNTNDTTFNNWSVFQYKVQY
jgi:hypothetical protein